MRLKTVDLHFKCSPKERETYLAKSKANQQTLSDRIRTRLRAAGRPGGKPARKPVEPVCEHNVSLREECEYCEAEERAVQEAEDQRIAAIKERNEAAHGFFGGLEAK
jgi:hypothetical protein